MIPRVDEGVSPAGDGGGAVARSIAIESLADVSCRALFIVRPYGLVPRKEK